VNRVIVPEELYPENNIFAKARLINNNNNNNNNDETVLESCYLSDCIASELLIDKNHLYLPIQVSRDL